MSRAFYNEVDPVAADWLERLIAAGEIAPGSVERNSVRDLSPEDLDGRTQAHFFAGIGGWSRALRLAGWPDDRPVWTGSCPCQPFSKAGKHAGFDDERHLWPSWFRLLRERRPPVVFGEQVASPAGLRWLDAVSADLEGEGYAVGAADLPAASVGAPHVRQRLWWVASLVGDPERAGLERRRARLRQRPGDAGRGREEGAPGGAGSPDDWSPADWLPCRDGKLRPVEPGTRPLAHGVPGRVGRLRGYGNAIVPALAAVFVRSAMDVLEVPQDGGGGGRS